MKFAIIVCALCFLVAVNEAAIAKGRFYSSDDPNKCTISDKVSYKPGETGKAPNNPCAGIKCLENGYVEFKTCDPVAPPKGCKQRGFVNTERNYPECCERTYDCTPKI